jgi:hypothetical protein
MRNLLVSTLAAAAVFAVAPAQAQVVTPAPTITFPAGGFFTATPGPAGTFSAALGRNNIGSGSFTDTYTFTLPASGVGSGSVTTSTSFSGIATDLDFGRVTINGILAPVSFTNGGLTETASASFVPITLGVLNTLVVSGTSRGAGSYGGQLTFVPQIGAVPEPGTWAMMIFGFGVAGAGLRARRRSTTLTYA